MKSLNVIISLLLLSAFFTSCNDDGIEMPESAKTESDTFIGDHRDIMLGEEAATFEGTDFTCRLIAPDGSEISRSGTFSRDRGNHSLYFWNGLKTGVYRMLYLEYKSTNESDGKYMTEQFGLGGRIEVTENGARSIDSYNSVMGMMGNGTAENPFIISCYTHLKQLKKIVNDRRTNGLVTPETHFKQCGTIDMDYACYSSNKTYGWDPIGNDSNVPFRGHYTGASLPGFYSLRPNSAVVGLFGYLEGATLDSISMPDARIEANFAGAAIAGAVISGGPTRHTTTIAHCSVNGGYVKGSDQSMALGGIVGGLDMHAALAVIDCHNDGTEVSATYNAGGIVGASGAFSCLSVNNCSNSGAITASYSGAGGVIGVADTLYVTGCMNNGAVKGAIAYNSSDKNNAGIGAGGIVGGSGISFLTACKNYGDISGNEGTGGIIGSTRVRGSNSEAYVYNNTMLRYCGNEGDVKGNNAVGGICGEAQFGCYGVYNKGNVTGNDYVAGIVGCTSIAVVQNTANAGDITGHSYTAGSIGKTVLGSVALCHNYGNIYGSGNTCAGILALAGNNTIVNNCGNFAPVTSTGNGAVGGVVGEIGDPRKWTAMNIAECVVGSMELVMSVAGPIISVVAEAAHGIGVFLEVGQLGVEAILTNTDKALFWLGVAESLDPEEMELIKTGIRSVVTDTGDDIKNELHAMRKNVPEFDSNGFNSGPLSSKYADYVKDNTNWIEASDNNVKSFNKKINNKRDDRYEELEALHESEERVHAIVAGVSIVVGIITTTAEIIASGGLAVPFIMASSVTALVGGINAVTKSVQDYQRNSVIISGCVNAGHIIATDKTGDKLGGVVGVLRDNCIFRDNLNIGRGPGTDDNNRKGGHFIGEAGSNVVLHTSITLAPQYSWDDLVAKWDRALFMDKDHIDLSCVYFYSDTYQQSAYILSASSPLFDHLNVSPRSRKSIKDKSRYTGFSINNGNSARWGLPTEFSNSYAMPARSEMR